MRRLIVFGIGGLLVLVVAAYVAIQITSRVKVGATFDQPVAALSIPEGDATAIARGEYLVKNVLGCGHSDCHRPDFGGGAVIDAPPMGLVYAPNLTAGRGSVTAGYTGEDWARILRHGLTRGKTRALIMPSEDYQGLSDADLAAAVAVRGDPGPD